MRQEVLSPILFRLSFTLWLESPSSMWDGGLCREDDGVGDDSSTSSSSKEEELQFRSRSLLQGEAPPVKPASRALTTYTRPTRSYITSLTNCRFYNFARGQFSRVQPCQRRNSAVGFDTATSGRFSLSAFPNTTRVPGLTIRRMYQSQNSYTKHEVCSVQYPCMLWKQHPPQLQQHP